MNIRPATLRDLPRLLLLERACPSAAHWTEQHYREALNPQSAGPQRLILVVEAEPQASTSPQSNAAAITGFLVARHLAPEWELENIVVAGHARRQGTGQQLLGALLARAQQASSQSVFLEVRESNVPGRALYEKAQFREAGRRKLYYSDPAEDAILYRRSLP